MLLSFNSSMVRLVAKTSRFGHAQHSFQFQYGAIGSLSEHHKRPDNLLSFNSSVVRLVAIFYENIFILPPFQFQCGAIGSSK